jgi:HK97 gp10 family phage protein
MSSYTVDIDAAAIAKLATSEAVMAAIAESGELDVIVAEMRRLAPKDTGKGAESINWELDPSGEFFRVTWDKAHFYMYFFEVGTVLIPARPFARPVADRFKN